MLGNIAGDQARNRDQCLNAGALPVIVDLLGKTTKNSCRRNSVWTVAW